MIRRRTLLGTAAATLAAPSIAAIMRASASGSMQRTGDAAATFKIRADVETGIRERAVNQAKETIGRRVDELGLREAAVTVRDEDIIIEVPGEDEKTFKEIRDIISQTARLEFKILDDGTDFFGPVSRRAKEELERLALAGRSTRGHHRASGFASRENFHLHGGETTGIQDFTSQQFFDFHAGQSVPHPGACLNDFSGSAPARRVPRACRPRQKSDN